MQNEGFEAAVDNVQLATAAKGERPLCCGRTLMSAGLVDEARSEVACLMLRLVPLADKGLRIVGL